MTNPDEELKELSEDDLFDGAVSDEPEIQPEPKAPQSEPEAKEPEPTASDAKLPPIPPKPEWRKKEDAEARRAAETELANERAEKAALKQRLDALERANQPKPVEQPKAEKPDPLLDPEGYAKSVRDEIRNEILNERREESLVRARDANQQEFDEAYAAAQKSVDPVLKARMQSSRDPGKTLLEWHRENKTRQEIGGDLNAYKQRLRDEALKDPEFRKAAMAAWQSEAQPLVNGRPRVELPPSLNGASRSNAALRSAMSADIDDDALFEQTTAG